MMRIRQGTTGRVSVVALFVLLLAASASGQHKIPPLPETALKPVKLPSGVTINPCAGAPCRPSVRSGS